ncbi:hypothetical protein KY284_001564 [Solanum tuberosum]|nr:hypothetical protein KY284_001564 [Solanum tuberosum]
MDKWLGIALQNGVKDLSCESITTTQVISCHSLRKLSLTEVGLDDNMLRALLNCCPLIDDFIIEHCRLLTKIERLISTSQFLERLTLDYVSTRLERFKICGSPSVKFLAIENCKGLQEIDAPTLVPLEYDGDQIPELKVAKRCRQLKKSQLCLDSLKILNAE